MFFYSTMTSGEGSASFMHWFQTLTALLFDSSLNEMMHWLLCFRGNPGQMPEFDTDADKTDTEPPCKIFWTL